MTIIKMHRDKESDDTYLILPVTLPSDFNLVIFKQGEKPGTGTEAARYDFDYDQNNKNLRDFLRSIKKPYSYQDSNQDSDENSNHEESTEP